MSEDIQQTEPSGSEFSTFSLGGALFGINILTIQEINKHMNTTKVPQSSDHIEGILNLRGRIVTIVDLGKKLGLCPVERDKDTRNIIVRSQEEYIGLMVDGIRDVIPADPEQIELPPSNVGGVKGKFFKGVLKTDNQLIGILDIDEVLKEEA